VSVVKKRVYKDNSVIKKYSISSEYLLFLSISDDLSCIIHIKKNIIIKIIHENEISLNLDIDTYIKNHNKLPLYFIMHDSALKIEMKTMSHISNVKTFIAMSRKFTNVIFSYAFNFTNTDFGKQNIITARLDRAVVHKNFLYANEIVIKSDNSSKCKILLHQVNQMIRAKYEIPANNLICCIFACQSGIFFIATCNENCLISLKHEKINDLSQQIHDNVDRIFKQHSKAGVHKDMHLPDHIPKVILFSDIRQISEANFSTEKIEVICNKDYYEQNIYHNIGIIEFISIITLWYKDGIKISNKDIAAKAIVLKIFKISKFLVIIALITSSIILTDRIILPYLKINSELQEIKSEINSLTREAPTTEEKNNYQLLKNLIQINAVNEAYNANDILWYRDLDNIGEMIRATDNINITSYNWKCGDSCLKNSNISNIKITIDVQNPSGYIHIIHFKINTLKNILQKRFGDVYDIIGLNFKYQFNKDAKYFNKSFEFNMKRKEKNEKSIMDGAKDLIVVSNDKNIDIQTNPEQNSIILKEKKDNVEGNNINS